MDINNHRKSVHSLYIKILCIDLESHGIDYEESLKAAHLPKDFMAQGEGFVSIFQFQQMADFARTRTGKKWLGLEIGQKISTSHHGPLGYMMASSIDPETAINALVKYISLRSPLLGVKLERNNNQACLRIQENVNINAIRDVFLESFFCVIINIIGIVYGKKLNISRLDLNYPKPDYHQHYQDFFQCPIYHNKPFSAVYFDVSVLKHKNLLSDSMAYRLAEVECEKLYLSLLSNDGLKSKIENIVLNPNAPFPTLEQTAHSLDISKSTFIRRLHKANTTYKEIVNSVRQELSDYYLIETKLSVENIADKLGYEDTSNFSRVFKRWHNTTPTQYRVSHRK